jgi:hypothetical protein
MKTFRIHFRHIGGEKKHIDMKGKSPMDARNAAVKQNKQSAGEGKGWTVAKVKVLHQ